MRKTYSLIAFLLISSVIWADETQLPSPTAVVVPMPQEKYLEETDLGNHKSETETQAPAQPISVPTPDAQYLEDEDLASPEINKIPLPEKKYLEESDMQYYKKPDVIMPKIPEDGDTPWKLWDLPKKEAEKAIAEVEKIEEPPEPPVPISHELSGRDISIEFGTGYAGFWGGVLGGTAIGLITAELSAPFSNCASCRDRTIRMLSATGSIAGTVGGIHFIGSEHNKDVSPLITTAGAILPLTILPFVLDSGFQFKFNEPDIFYTVLIPLSATLAYNIAWQYLDQLPSWLRNTPPALENVSLYMGKTQQTMTVGLVKYF